MVLHDIAVNIHGESKCVRFMETNAANLLDQIFVRRHGEIPEAPPMIPAAAPPTTPTESSETVPAGLDDVTPTENENGLVTNLTFYCPNIRIPFGHDATVQLGDLPLPIEEYSAVNFQDLTINGNFRRDNEEGNARGKMCVFDKVANYSQCVLFSFS